ncbi:hypothetical protein IFM89_014604 [Coptis chinensis]|uniref:Uncharacterized protein n=1 Tax=Coptis chinensis TaxID=261450 RepID=A0A835HAW4_9MAGN|nr:hypothetical protein IFM89_014604 [Coptis chinensis]
MPDFRVFTLLFQVFAASMVKPPIYLLKSVIKMKIGSEVPVFQLKLKDKIGALTDNKMEFPCASIHGVDFSGAKAHSDTKQKGYCTQGTYGYMPVERTSGHIIVDIQGERQR